MNVPLEAIRALREKTSASLKDVREALEASGGDEGKAIEWLRQRGAEIAEQRKARATGQARGAGRVESYIHHDGRLGALVEVHCETDFVARTEGFVQFCRDVALQVAGMSPRYIRKEEVPESNHLSAEELKALCLLEQPFVRDAATTLGDLLKALVAKTGENVVICRFLRFSLGEEPTATHDR